MIRHALIFAAAFAVGALIAVALRTAGHRPYDDHAAPAAAGQVADPHAGGSDPTPAVRPASTSASAAQAVNTICAICGMPVDPRLGTIEYKGRPIGFGCKTCPPKFRAEPEKYGEAALKNQVVE